jgi:hypothetical protein
VLRSSDKYRKRITSITAVLLPSVTYVTTYVVLDMKNDWALTQFPYIVVPTQGCHVISQIQGSNLLIFSISAYFVIIEPWKGRVVLS